MTPLTQITERVMRYANPELRTVPTPLLTLEEFFERNDFEGSIGCNLISRPAPDRFYDLLRSVRSKLSVSDVKVQITCVDHLGRDWPFSDTIWIMTDSSPSDVQRWFPDDVRPTSTWAGWTKGTLFESCAIVEGHEPVAVWFD